MSIRRITLFTECHIIVFGLCFFGVCAVFCSLGFGG